MSASSVDPPLPTLAALERSERAAERTQNDLRSLVDEKLKALREIVDHEMTQVRTLHTIENASLRELLDQRAALIADDLRRQAIEYERRLSDLNHAHDLATQVQSRTLQRDIFEQFVATLSRDTIAAKSERDKQRENDRDVARRELESVHNEIVSRIDLVAGEQRTRWESVNKQLTTMESNGATMATASARAWSIGTGILILIVSIVANLLIRIASSK